MNVTTAAARCVGSSLLLETVDDDLRGLADFLINQEILGVCPLVPRKLDDLPVVRVLCDGTVAGEVLLEGLADALHVQVVGEALDEGDTLAPVALLHADVHLRLIAAFLIGVREGVEVLI